MLQRLAVDARFALRALRANVALVSVAILLLMIGLGATSAVVRMARGLLLDPLPGVRHQEVWALGRNTLSAPDFQELRAAAAADGIADVAAYVGVRMGMQGREGERLVRGALISDNYFDVLGVRPVLGRGLEAEDASRPVAIIADRLWRDHFERDPDAIGATITLGEETFTVIGVAPPGFAGVDLEYATEVWVPIALHPRVLPAQAAIDLPKRRAVRWLGGIARIEDRATVARARAWIDAWIAKVSEEFPKGRQGWSIQLVPLAEAAISSDPRRAIVDLLRMIAIASGLILLITCANLAILLLVGLIGRGDEIGVRLAHGASPERIARQLLFEILAIAALGGGAGLWVGGWLAGIGQRLVLPPQIAPTALGLDRWTFAITLVAAIVFSLLASLPLLWRLRRVEVMGLIRRGAAGAGMDRVRSSVVGALIAGQTALTLLLLHGVFLVSGSLTAQLRIDPGFTVDGVTLATIDVAVTGLSPEAGRRLYRRLQQDLDAAPGVESAALATLAPIGDNRLLWNLARGGEPEGLTVAGNVVSPGYFQSMGISLLGGRDFDFELDGPEREQAVVINATLARRLWPGEKAVGRQIDVAGFGGAASYRVIGVVADSRHGALQAPPEPFLYRPLAQDHQRIAVVHARTSLPIAAVGELLRARIDRLDPRVPVAEIRTLAREVDAALARPRYLAQGMGLLGTMAALLTAVGLYGILSFTVHRQAREIGIRMSLGARPARVRREILGRGLRLIVLGLVPGVVLAIVFNRLLASHLYGLSTFDAPSLVGAVLLLVAVTLLASGLPAHRATAVDPATMLREA